MGIHSTLKDWSWRKLTPQNVKLAWSSMGPPSLRQPRPWWEQDTDKRKKEDVSGTPVSLHLCIHVILMLNHERESYSGTGAVCREAGKKVKAASPLMFKTYPLGW